jgi:hypothetical protein
MLQFIFNPSSGAHCPICGKATESEATLIPIWSDKDHSTVEAIQVHIDCLAKELQYVKLNSGAVIMVTCEYPYRKRGKS